MLVKSNQFLTLALHLHIDVFGDCVDVLHDGFDLADLLLSLLDHLLHVVSLCDQLKSITLNDEDRVGLYLLLLLVHLHLKRGLLVIMISAVLARMSQLSSMSSSTYESLFVARSMKSISFSLIC